MDDDFVQRFLSSPEQVYRASLDILHKTQFSNRDWNREYRAKLAELGLCLRYKKTRPYHVQAPLPTTSSSYSWPRGMFIVEAVPLHPLHLDEWYERQGEQGIQADPDRFTGRTTVLALRIIHDAIVSPHQKIDIIDHAPIRAADKQLARIIADMIGQLGLNHLHIDMNNREEFTLVFERRDLNA